MIHTCVGGQRQGGDEVGGGAGCEHQEDVRGHSGGHAAREFVLHIKEAAELHVDVHHLHVVSRVEFESKV